MSKYPQKTIAQAMALAEDYRRHVARGNVTAAEQARRTIEELGIGAYDKHGRWIIAARVRRAMHALPYATTYHRDGTVTYWSSLEQQWRRSHAGRIDPAELATLSPVERARIARMADKAAS